MILQTHKFCDIAGFRPVTQRSAAPTGQSERTGTICHLIESLYCQMLCWNDPCCHEAPMLWLCWNDPCCYDTNGGRGGHSSLSGIRDWMCLLTRHTSCELVSPLVFMIFDNYLISLLIYWSHCWIIHGCDAAVSAPGTAQSFHFTDTPSAVYDACLDWVLLNFKLASRAVWLNIDHCDRFMRQENGLN